MEIAEAFAKGSAKPKRSLIFPGRWARRVVGLGVVYQPSHRAARLDRTDLNLDMVGRGATDVPARTRRIRSCSAENYLQLVGSRPSTELGACGSR
jgi:hypothetical protein